MKILIVDDELLVRIGIKSCINWQEYGMEIAAEASDGVEALEMLKEYKPDVMLLDIKMPNMDGIQLMQKMKEESIHCKVLILSGFDDLFHVKQAMKYGAIDYFHKPCMSSKDILDALLDIKGKLSSDSPEGNSRNDSGTGERSKSILKEAFLRDLIDGRINDSREFDKRAKEAASKLENMNFCCCVFKVKDAEEIQKRYINSSNTLQNSVMNIMSGVLTREAGVEIFAAEENLYVTIISSAQSVSEKKLMENVSNVTELISDAMKQFLNVEIAAGVSDLHKTCSGIKNAFEEALKAVRFKFFIKDRNIIYYRDMKRINEREPLLFVETLIGKMKAALSRHDFINFEGLLEEFICFIEEQPCISEADVKKIFNVFLFLAKDGKAFLNEVDRLNNCKSLRQLHDIWVEIIHEKLEGVKNSVQFRNCSFLVKNIINYLEENYSKEITLNLLSKQFNVSPNYISRLFREETGETLFNYINAIRVEKAKGLLKDIELKIYEVGDKVGFKSPVHFNIVFNKFTGQTPKQYRDNI